MRRRYVHACLGAVLAVSLGTALLLTDRLHRDQAWNASLAQAQDPASAEAADDAAPPELQLARAQALARKGRRDEALAAYRRLVKDPAAAGLLAEVHFHLGNFYLREGLKKWAERPDEAYPLVELSKQSYREALRRRPEDWDARYNLERALWLAPELEPPPPEEDLPPEAKERTISTLPGARLELP